MIRQIFRFIYHILILYGFILATPLFYGLNSRYVVLVIATLTLIIKQDKLREVIKHIKVKNLEISFLLMISCAMIVLLSINFVGVSHNYVNQYIEWWHFIYQFFYLVIFSLFCVVEFSSLDEFAWTWVSFIVIESILIYVAIVNTSVRMWFYSISYTGDGRFDYTVEAGMRIMGLGIYASDGSLTMSTGIMTLVLLKLKDIIKDAIFLICTIIIVSATLFIGRTGLLVELIILVLYVLLSRRVVSSMIYGGLAAVVIVSIMGYFLSQVSPEASERLQEWISAAFDHDSRMSTFNVAKGTGFQYNEHYLFGNAGLMRGYAGGIMYWSDSGYIKMFTAIGIIGSIMYYVGMFYILSSPIKRNIKGIIRYLIYGLIIMAFVIEYKEPYFTKLRIPWFVFTITLFCSYYEDFENMLVQRKKLIKK